MCGKTHGHLVAGACVAQLDVVPCRRGVRLLRHEGTLRRAFVGVCGQDIRHGGVVEVAIASVDFQRWPTIEKPTWFARGREPTRKHDQRE